MKQTKALAYVGLFTVLAGDAVRNTFSWAGWGAICAIMAGLALTWIFKYKPWATLKQIPWPLTAFLALILLSTIWSNYQRQYLRENYIMVYQDVRGRYMSEGEFVNIRPFNPSKKGNNRFSR